ncbi:NAD(P)H-hydrate dehydratase [Sneathiella aquimaris]|uniref:NAD(P)H-hydrate dehydratase n=1 Tax=Sneathiella aquimaris TaxID=2599305 RepID=UPI00146D5B8F|nr:NAD(P)H-hydrate dehydratase [Sneathiella aquimaris]
MTLGPEILTVEQMYQCDSWAIKKGVPGRELMENAGQGVAAFIEEGWDLCPIGILCGPGNNGGDGYVVARALFDAGWPVQVFVYGDVSKLSGDALEMYEKCSVATAPLSEIGQFEAGVFVDALFGTGFRGTLPAEVVEAFEHIRREKADIIAVDVPSGLDGNTGAISPGTPEAVLTVSFFRAKRGHYLDPGKDHIGLLKLIDIGIPEDVLDKLDDLCWLNEPGLWVDAMPVAQRSGHKYDRGHAGICGGGMTHTGAARLTARCALRAGAGAVSVISPPSAIMTYSAALEAVMLLKQDNQPLEQIIEEKRLGTIVVGPANGVTEKTRENALAAVSSDVEVVLDADALTVFQEEPDRLFAAIKKKKIGAVVLTPHSAEFARLFKKETDAIASVRAAARLSGAIVLLKGATTVIADPDGTVALNVHAPPWMATAGSGDALAGIIAGFISGGMKPFLAVMAATWVHGQAGYRFGPGLIAEDIEKEIPAILQSL